MLLRNGQPLHPNSNTQQLYIDAEKWVECSECNIWLYHIKIVARTIIIHHVLLLCWASHHHYSLCSASPSHHYIYNSLASLSLNSARPIDHCLNSARPGHHSLNPVCSANPSHHSNSSASPLHLSFKSASPHPQWRQKINYSGVASVVLVGRSSLPPSLPLSLSLSLLNW